MLVNRFSTSRPAIKFLELNLLSSVANKNESWTVYSFSVKDFETGMRNLAKSYVCVPIADRLGWNDGQLSSSGLWTLACP